ncbi:MAG: rRNA pseudouridine synthase [Streptococcaceae bacterium]|jgi:23S rRNA pseudouridine2605 synthase|nr:rRNA pseudouridine synthase [Streptococcaceae bacterium]
MRINKYLAHAGVASRRKSEALILAGKVRINGTVITDLAFQVSEADSVTVDEQSVYQEEFVYYVLNKPRGVISSVKDEKGRQTVLDLLPMTKERIYPVGRLDWDTTGLLLLTNDGEFAQQMMHPSHQIDKVYVAKVAGIATKENLRPLTRGMILDKQKISPASYKILEIEKTQSRSSVELTIHEGHNHQVKRMFEEIGLPVQKLKRIQFGVLTLDNLPLGRYRELTAKEVKTLKEMT